MEKTGMVATDGVGGKVAQRSRRHRAVGAGAAVVTFDENREPIREALLVAKVPGRQTVPRAEAWAVSEVLQIYRGETPLKIITDASYVVKGFMSHNKTKYMKRPQCRHLGKDIQQDGRAQDQAIVAQSKKPHRFRGNHGEQC